MKDIESPLGHTTSSGGVGKEPAQELPSPPHTLLASSMLPTPSQPGCAAEVQVGQMTERGTSVSSPWMMLQAQVWNLVPEPSTHRGQSIDARASISSRANCCTFNNLVPGVRACGGAVRGARYKELAHVGVPIGIQLGAQCCKARAIVGNRLLS